MSGENLFWKQCLSEYLALYHRARQQGVVLPRRSCTRCLNAVLVLRKLSAVPAHSLSSQQLRMAVVTVDDFERSRGILAGFLEVEGIDVALHCDSARDR